MKKAILAGLIILIGGLCLWFWGRPAYRHHQEQRALLQAEAYMARGEFRNASLSARRALQANPRNIQACKIMADLAERARSPVVLDWWRRIAETAPTVQNKLMLASVAMHSQGPPYLLTTQTLEELGASATNVAAYHAIAAELALRLKRPSDAADHFEAASRLEPTNAMHSLNLAVLQLQSTNPAASTTGRQALERLCSNTNLDVVALRWLVADSLGHGDPAKAQSYSERLLADSRAGMEDRLQHLTILQKSQAPQLTNFLGALQKASLTNGPDVYAISAWMISHGQADEAFAWINAFPAKLRAEHPVPLALVDCYLARKDWRGLDTFLLEQQWGDLDFLRFAFLSRTATELNQRMAAEARWRTAVRQAGERLGPLTGLLALATTWGHKEAREELLWQVAKHFPKDRWALRELERAYIADGNTSGLQKVYSTMASYSPQNYVAQNNLAATCLLLKLNLPMAHSLAKELFTKHPDQAVVASTYAFSLHVQGRNKDALAVLQKLKPADLETPAVALYYGLVLHQEANAEAEKYLNLARQAPLLPEEKALLSEATKNPASRSQKPPS